MKSNAKMDLTRGPLISQAILFALPICAGSILQQLYNTVDTLVVGNYCGSASLAAIGTSGQPIEILLCLFMGLGAGVSILVAQYTGSGEGDKQRLVIRAANALLYICALPMTVIGLFLGPQLLRLMQVPPDAWEEALSYMRIVLLGTLGNLGYNINAGILRGVGDSRSTLWFLLISCLVNIALDLLFVAVFHMAAAGAALATAIAMYVSWVSSMVYIRSRYPDLRYSPLPRGADRQALWHLAKVGLPLGLNNSFYSVGHFFLQTFINAQGSAFMAACSVGGKVNGIANVAIVALSSACTAFAGQNLGARRYDRLLRGGWQIPLFSGGLNLAAGLLVAAFCEPILRLFTPDEAVVLLAARYVRIVLPFMWTYAVLNGIISFVNGMGVVKYPTVVNVLMLWAVRIPVAYLISTYWDGQYIMVSYPISFAFGMGCMLAFFLSRRWREVRQLARHQGA